MKSLCTLLFLLATVAPRAQAHAPILPAIKGPLTTRGNVLVDSTGDLVLLRGVHMPGLEVPDAPPANVAAINAVSFGVLRVRWNVNTVRLPVSVAVWRRDGQPYLDRVAAIVRLANDRDLAVVLAAHEDARSGSEAATGLPSTDTMAFWRAWAAHFKDNPRVIFAVFNQLSARRVPGAISGSRTVADWQFWLRGGTLSGGQRAFGMQEVVDAIRAAGAAQLIAVPAFDDALGFRNFTSDLQPRDANLLYEVHPYYDYGLTDSERTDSFGSLAFRVPVYAGEWGLTLRENRPGCVNLPRDPQRVIEILFQTLAYFDFRQISWTAASFEAGGLLLDLTDYAPTALNGLWTCGVASNPQPGMGEVLLLWTTGDPTGFGALSPDRVANAAGGPASPAVPGQLMTLYVEQLGPAPEAPARFDENGKLPVNLGGTQVLFDGVAAPLLYAGQFQINVQVPYELAGARTTTAQVFFRGVPSSRATLEVAEAAPELFQDINTRTAIVLNQDGAINGFATPAAAGSIVVLFASGGGQTSPPGVTGAAARSPHPTLTLPAAVTVDGQPAEVLFAGQTPGFVGLVQINARLPQLPGAQGRRAVPVTLRIGTRTSRSATLIWVL